MRRRSEALATLGAPGLTLARTIAAVQSLEDARDYEREVSIGISANISVDLMGLYLRKRALMTGARVQVHMGQYDEHVANVERFIADQVREMLFLPFFDNLLPAFELQLGTMSAEQVAAKEADVRSLCRLVFTKAKALRQVYACSFHLRMASIDTGDRGPATEAIGRFNEALREEAAAFDNVRVVDTAAIIDWIGLKAAIDDRFYLKNTAPYTPAFLDELAHRVVSASRGFNGYYHKVLVLDCDNTLWGGIVGEDQLSGIHLDPNSHPGRIYWQAQQAFLRLERSGILLCLCSKNNSADVNEVLEKHPDAVLKPSHIAAARVNWQDKVSNLKALAEELNLGLDSFVFLDDSDFECDAVRRALPSVRVLQVPKSLSDYPTVCREISELFLSGGVSTEGRSKTAQYRQRREAITASAEFSSHEEYLASLSMGIAVRRNEVGSTARISELTLKSNQFNLTTLRQTPTEIGARMARDDGAVYSVTVSDRFGSAGLTGVMLVNWRDAILSIDAFLMSCRVIGRGVEFALWPTVIGDAAARGCTRVHAQYLPSPKNVQVASFFEQLGLDAVADSNGIKHYRAPLGSIRPPATDWIKVEE